ncbi:MAG: hypothetical protein AAGF33_11580 [Pseudomonadota bacterium]
MSRYKYVFLKHSLDTDLLMGQILTYEGVTEVKKFDAQIDIHMVTESFSIDLTVSTEDDFNEDESAVLAWLKLKGVAFPCPTLFFHGHWSELGATLVKQITSQIRSQGDCVSLENDSFDVPARGNPNL